MGNIQMAFAVLSLFTIQILHTKGSMMKSWFSLYPIGTTTRCLHSSKHSSASPIPQALSLSQNQH